ncbi:acyl-CoA dehydrogenase family protein [Actinokineospora sp. G85]|uniref:acyl-CoA dehydrogenase family protein n=1 Tax=Actinokineospora sp. G85 TaxID=3406626 RepID=UPI003C74F7A6
MPHLLDAAHDLAPALAARADEVDAGRELPVDLVKELKAAGFFRMFVPRSHGGAETIPRDGIAVLERLARADAATGWTVMIGSESPLLLALLPRERFDALYADSPDVVVAGGFNAQGGAEPVDGGYRVSGRWNFCSGARHADLLFGNCVLTDGGAPVVGDDGVPAMRAALLPGAEVIDTWRVLGLRGTGSDDIAVTDALCPDTFDIFTGTACVPGGLYNAPLVHCALHMAAVAIGTAQGAIDDVVVLATGGKQRLYAKAPLLDSPVFQVHLGRAEASVRAARALLAQVADEFWAEPAAWHPSSAKAGATLSWITETCVAAVDTCYRAGGGGAARDSSSLQRRFRDVHTMSQHAGSAEGWLGTGGVSLLGAGAGLG